MEKFDKMEIVWLVPKFHLAAHVDACADCFSFNYTPLVGRTCGEMVESNWSPLVKRAASIREMGHGRRCDTLGDIMADWNYRKNTHAGVSCIGITSTINKDSLL